jgi:PAS domain S-box-containing protein
MVERIERDSMARDEEILGFRAVPDGAATLSGATVSDIGLLDAVDLPIIVINRDCSIGRINRAATTVLGLPVSAVGNFLGKTLAGVENLEELCAQVMVDGTPCRRETRDGDRCFLLRIAPYTGPDRQILGAVLTFTNVTAFRASIDQAIYEREYTKAILNTVTDPLVVLDAKLQVQTANRAFYALFGLSRDETHSVSIRQLGNKEWETSAVWKSIETALSGGTQLQPVEIDREFPEIGNRTVLLNACRLARDGHALILLTFQDVSERKRAERALRESEERFRAIVETTPECVKLISGDGTLLHMNSPGLQMVGAHSADEVIGRNVYDLIAPGDRDRFKAFNETICQGQNGSLQFDIVGLEGKRRHMETRAAPLRNPDGTVVHLAVTSDISQRKQAEELLRRSEERFRALVNASSDMVYRMNPDWSEMRLLDGGGLITDTVNPVKDWIGEYIHPEDRPLVLQTIREAVRTRSLFQLEHRVLRTDGTPGWTYSRAIPLLKANGQIEEWFGAASDVTARKEAEENFRRLAQTLDAEVRARTRELEERNTDVLKQSEQVRELSWQLLHSQEEERRHIARELHDSAGQTLTLLGIGLAQLVQKAGRNAPELASEAERIQETVQQLHREIRTTSYLLHPPLLDESGLCSAIGWYIQGLPERSGLEVRLDLSEEFGRLPRDMELVIFRLVQECLTNIHRHSESKTASIRMARESNQIRLDIRDQGKGILPARLSEIQSGHSGMGIRGMRERLRQFGGTLNIESDDSGTRIVAMIPLPKGLSPESQGKAEPLEAPVRAW